MDLKQKARELADSVECEVRDLIVQKNLPEDSVLEEFVNAFACLVQEWEDDLCQIREEDSDDDEWDDDEDIDSDNLPGEDGW